MIPPDHERRQRADGGVPGTRRSLGAERLLATEARPPLDAQLRLYRPETVQLRPVTAFNPAKIARSRRQKCSFN